MQEVWCKSGLPVKIFLRWLVEVNEDAWKSKLATKNIPAKDGLNSGNSKLKKRMWGETEGNVEKQVGVNESMEELLESQQRFTLKNHKTKQVWKARCCHLPPYLPGLLQPSPSREGAPGMGAASTFLFVIDLLINKRVGISCCFVCKSKQACSEFKHCKLSLALGIQTLFCFLLAISSLAEKLVGDCAGGQGRWGDSSPHCSIPGSAPNPPNSGSCRKTKHSF